MKRTYLVVVLLAVFTPLICIFTIPLYAQRADRGVITGIVTDQTGSAVVGAIVKVRNEGTGVETLLNTNAAGAYTTPLLVLGSYSITADHPGFKASVTSGVQVLGA